ncbi:hypothetical protein G3A49_17065 [Haloferax volcanii]|uniref:Uncharacterized protein n=3 Tax=Haloferax volcanii TaxID=2246 RepID=A0A6C0V368_HALVO|nr:MULTISPECIES: hypothetical protein [Haloferax]ELZ76737.1 hypothetical protein C456_03601 [Haloferax lucentense DSM 14919]ELZ86304.1 hypothetical protein C452_17238 [Haloferax alexandrinus JCM 10717]NLV04284.1 hypothetical protein [Haloferax alexandrinus]QIB79718.1 hypothetical protein G3A49_17065 [Haloferax alexandrinus]TVT94180.1 hypothetical protein FQA18_13345 [Haloferax volcanii]
MNRRRLSLVGVLLAVLVTTAGVAAAAPNDTARESSPASEAGQRGPPGELPDSVPDLVSGVHDLVSDFLSGALDGSLGGSLSDRANDVSGA